MRIGNITIDFYRPRKHYGRCGIDGLIGGDRECRQFAKSDVDGILFMISSRMHNVLYKSDVETIDIKRIATKLHDDAASVIRHMFYDGSVSIHMPTLAWSWELDREASQYNGGDFVTICDDVFRNTGETRSQRLRPQIDFLNTVNDSDLNLIMNYGSMGVLSPENSSRADGYLDDREIERMQEDYRKHYGLRFGKWALMITRNPVKFQKIDMPIAELQLMEKRKAALSSILQFMNVPKELHAFFENAKYSNRNEAELDMYGNTVSYWASVFVKMFRSCYEWLRINQPAMRYPTDNEIWFDIVGVPALQDKKNAEIEAADKELDLWKKLREEMPGRSDEINERINAIIDRI